MGVADRLVLTEAMVSEAFMAGNTLRFSAGKHHASDRRVEFGRGRFDRCGENPRRFPPHSCRDHVLQGGFTHLDMARQYLTYYEYVMSNGNLGANSETSQIRSPDSNPISCFLGRNESPLFPKLLRCRHIPGLAN